MEGPQRAMPTIPPPSRSLGAGGPSLPTHQVLLTLGFLSPGLPALPHHLDGRSGWVWGDLKGEKSTVTNQMTAAWRAIWPLSGNLPALLTIQHLIQRTVPKGQMQHWVTPGTPALQGSQSSGGEGPGQSQSRVIRAVTTGPGNTKDL